MAHTNEPGKPEGGARSPIVDAYYKPKDQSPKLPRVYDYTKEIPMEKTQGGHRLGTILAMCLACVILGVGLGSIHSRQIWIENSAEPIDRIVSVMTAMRPAPTADPAEMTLTSGEIYDLAKQQTVEIRIGSEGEERSCSGVILTADGYILTNAHLLGGTPEEADIAVTLSSGEQYTARLMGYERTGSDLAILKINGEALPEPVTGDINEMDVGDRVYAVGNSRGQNSSAMAEGMITDPEREQTIENRETGRRARMNLFRISAAVSDGNNGGPVYNDRGKIIGIVTACPPQTDGPVYCIPINDAELVARRLIESRYVGGRPRMGIIAQTVSETVADYYARYDPEGMVPGVLVYAIDENGCAGRAGIRQGDIIVRFGCFAIGSEADLAAAEKEYRAGENVAVTVFRAGEEQEIAIRLEDKRMAAEDAFYLRFAGEKEY